MNNFPLPLIIFFGLLCTVCLLGIFMPGNVVEVTAKYFKWLMKLYGFEGEIKPTPKASMICRSWHVFILVVLFCFIFMVFSAKPR